MKTMFYIYRLFIVCFCWLIYCNDIFSQDFAQMTCEVGDNINIETPDETFVNKSVSDISTYDDLLNPVTGDEQYTKYVKFRVVFWGNQNSLPNYFNAEGNTVTENVGNNVDPNYSGVDYAEDLVREMNRLLRLNPAINLCNGSSFLKNPNLTSGNPANVYGDIYDPTFYDNNIPDCVASTPICIQYVLDDVLFIYDGSTEVDDEYQHLYIRGPGNPWHGLSSQSGNAFIFGAHSGIAAKVQAKIALHELGHGYGLRHHFIRNVSYNGSGEAPDPSCPLYSTSGYNCFGTNSSYGTCMVKNDECEDQYTLSWGAADVDYSPSFQHYVNCGASLHADEEWEPYAAHFSHLCDEPREVNNAVMSYGSGISHTYKQILDLHEVLDVNDYSIFNNTNNNEDELIPYGIGVINDYEIQDISTANVSASNPITLNAGSGYIEYRWFNGIGDDIDINNPFSTSSTVNITEDGVYTVVVKDENNHLGIDRVWIGKVTEYENDSEEFTYLQTFDDFEVCGKLNNDGFLLDEKLENADAICSLEQLWENCNANDQLDWGIGNGCKTGIYDFITYHIQEPTAQIFGKGPGVDKSSRSGYYLRFEPTGGNEGDRACVLSPLFDMSQACSAELKFWAYSEESSSLTVEVYTDNGGWLSLDSFNPNNPSDWVEYTFDVSNHISEATQFRFTATVQAGGIGEIAIDDFSLNMSTTIDEPNIVVIDECPNQMTFCAEGMYDTYVWEKPDGSTIENECVTVDMVGFSTITGDYTLTVGLNGCTASAVETITDVSPIVFYNDVYTCSGNTVTLTSMIDNGDSYIWTGPGGFTSNQEEAVVTLPGFYNVAVTTGNCTCYETIQLHLTESPNFNLNSDATDYCYSEINDGIIPTVNIETTEQNFINYVDNIDWTINGQLIESANNMMDLSLNGLDGTGTYVFNCIITVGDCTYVESFSINIHSSSGEIIYNDDDPGDCLAILETTNGASCEWFLLNEIDGTFYSVDNNGDCTLFAIEPGTYYAEVTTQFGCLYTTEPISVLGVNALSINNALVNETDNVFEIDSDMKIYGTVVVPANKELIIEQDVTIEFTENSGIVVENGGILTIEAFATLTNACESPSWKGIEVNGTSAYDHYPYVDSDNFPEDRPTLFHGIVEVTAGSTIENAEIGINAIPVEDCNNCPGGLVFVESTAFPIYFKNNTIDINIDYSDFMFNNFPINASVIHGAVFERNQEGAGVKLNNVPDFDFYNNKIEGLYNENNQLLTGSGLLVYNGQVVAQNNEFKFLKEAVAVYNSDLTSCGACLVSEYRDNYFYFCDKGITASIGMNDYFADNYFSNIPPANSEKGDTYGIRLAFHSDYTIEGNIFAGVEDQGSENPSLFASYGLVVQGAGQGSTSKVIDNYFYETEYGLSTEGIQLSDGSFAKDNNLSLEVGCNQFGFNNEPHSQTAWAVFNVPLGDQGIGCSGNYDDKMPLNQWRYNNDDATGHQDMWVGNLNYDGPLENSPDPSPIGFKYYALTDGSNQDYTFPNNATSEWANMGMVYNRVECVAFSSEIANALTICQDRLNGIVPPIEEAPNGLEGEPPIPPGCPVYLEAVNFNVLEEMAGIKSTIDETNEQINQIKIRLDGNGQTYELLNIIDDPSKTDQEIKSILDTVSFASKEVQKRVINRSVPITSNVLADILIPKSPLSIEVIKNLEERPTPVSTSSWNEIAEVQEEDGGFSLIESLERDNSKKLAEFRKLEKDRIQCFTAQEDWDGIRGFINNSITFEGVKTYANLSLAQGDFVKAREAITDLKDFYPNDDVFEDMEQVYDVLLAHKVNNQSLNNLTNEEIAILEEIANKEVFSEASLSARLLLSQVNDTEYQLPPLQKINTEYSGKKGPRPFVADDWMKIHLYPNPTSKLATVKTNLSQRGSLEIYDSQGIFKEAHVIESGEFLLEIEVEDWNKGLYIYQLLEDGEVMNSGKLLVND